MKAERRPRVETRSEAAERAQCGDRALRCMSNSSLHARIFKARPGWSIRFEAVGVVVLQGFGAPWSTELAAKPRRKSRREHLIYACGRARFSYHLVPSSLHPPLCLTLHPTTRISIQQL